MTAPPWYLPGHSDHGPRSLVLSSSQRYPDGMTGIPKFNQKCVESPKNWRFFHQNEHWKKLEAKLITGPNILPKHPKLQVVLAVNTVRHAGQPIQVVSGHLILLRLLSTIQKPLMRLFEVRSLLSHEKRIPIKQRGFHSVIQSVLTNVNRKNG